MKIDLSFGIVLQILEQILRFWIIQIASLQIGKKFSPTDIIFIDLLQADILKQGYQVIPSLFEVDLDDLMPFQEL